MLEILRSFIATIRRVLFSTLVLRLVCSAFAVWVATLLISGIRLTTNSGWGKVGALLLVALLIGVANAVLKPIIKTIGCALYVATLGLIALVVNGFLFWLVGWVCGQLGIPFQVENFWPSAVLGALLVSVVSWALGVFVKDRGDHHRPSPRPARPTYYRPQ